MPARSMFTAAWTTRRVDAAGSILRRAQRRIQDRSYEPDMVRVLRREIRPAAVCVDVGAYRGVITNVMRRRAGRTGRVIAVEAHPTNVATLNRRFRSAPNVTVVHAAAGAAPGRTLLYPARDSHMSEWTTDAAFAARVDTQQVERHGIEIPVVRIDDLTTSADVVKIDVEGGAGAVLGGMRGLLESSQPLIVLEYHSTYEWDAITILLDSGYRLEHPSGARVDSPARSADVPYHVICRPG